MESSNSPGILENPVENHEILGNCGESREILWNPKNSYGILGNLMRSWEILRNLRKSSGFQGNPVESQNSYEILGDHMCIRRKCFGILRNLRTSDGILRILMQS